jgi:hypothetical protein
VHEKSLFFKMGGFLCCFRDEATEGQIETGEIEQPVEHGVDILLFQELAEQIRFNQALQFLESEIRQI